VSSTDLINKLKNRYGVMYVQLSRYINDEKLVYGINDLEKLNHSFSDLLNGRLNTPQCYALDHGYARYHVYHLTPALCRIADKDWVSIHLNDIYLLINSENFNSIEKKTVIKWFGHTGFHVAVQATPISDDLVKSICHTGGEELILHTAGKVSRYHVADGSYPPPACVSSENYDWLTKCVSIHRAVFPAISLS